MEGGGRCQQPPLEGSALCVGPRHDVLAPQRQDFGCSCSSEAVLLQYRSVIVFALNMKIQKILTSTCIKAMTTMQLAYRKSCDLFVAASSF